MIGRLDFDSVGRCFLVTLVVVYGFHAVEGRAPCRSLICSAGVRCNATSQVLSYPHGREISYADLAKFQESRCKLSYPSFVLPVLRRRFADRKQAVVTVHIGPNVLSENELGIYRWIFAATRGRCFFVFVEPQAWLHEKLEAVLLGAGFSPEHFRLVKAAICPGGQASLPFYTVSVDHARGSVSDEKLDWLLKASAQTYTLDRETLTMHLTTYRKIWGYGFSDDEWQKVVSGPLIKEINVVCLTPTALLQEFQISPAAVEYYVVDAEGVDADIVENLLATPDLAPAILQFEGLNTHGDREEKQSGLLSAVHQLADRGYDVHMDGVDIVGVKRKP
eukprot:TRINITY_DN46858_c0_g1_i1.p1 TRINITY_DN46858_c0_g1~~TRINITY_DN46858_c0_g1_i1.p1  ORF type:complete len:356 (+),score=21.20 TRINITY_DN46858_c0_g1_i1:68-1069(+)